MILTHVVLNDIFHFPTNMNSLTFGKIAKRTYNRTPPYFLQFFMLFARDSSLVFIGIRIFFFYECNQLVRVADTHAPDEYER